VYCSVQHILCCVLCIVVSNTYCVVTTQYVLYTTIRQQTQHNMCCTLLYTNKAQHNMCCTLLYVNKHNTICVVHYYAQSNTTQYVLYTTIHKQNTTQYVWTLLCTNKQKTICVVHYSTQTNTTQYVLDTTKHKQTQHNICWKLLYVCLCIVVYNTYCVVFCV
jgi:hypothetical protein